MTTQFINIDKNSNYKTPIELKQFFLSSNFNETKHFTFLHLNTISLIKKADALHQLICDLSVEPEVICITETKLNSRSNINFAHLNNYSFIHKDSLSNSGGVGMYIKKGLEFNERKDIKLFNKDVESLWADITIGKNKLITVGVVYKHPKFKIPDFSDLFHKTLTKLNDENHNFYIM